MSSTLLNTISLVFGAINVKLISCCPSYNACMRVGILLFCVNVLSQVAKILKKIAYMESTISIRMAQFPFLYSLTLTFIFKVKLWHFICFANFSLMAKDEPLLLLLDIFSIEWHHCIMTVIYIFKVTNCVMLLSRKR